MYPDVPTKFEYNNVSVYAMRKAILYINKIGKK